MINWEVILWTCITVAVLLGIVVLLLIIVSTANMKKRRQKTGDIHTTLAVGSKIMFAGGIYGKVVRMGDEVIGVEIAPDVVIDISRFAVQVIEN